jgi:hypothetical protein
VVLPRLPNAPVFPGPVPRSTSGVYSNLQPPSLPQL